MKIQEVDNMMVKTSEAYSFSRYGAGAWRKSIENLFELGYNKKEVEWILNSKLMRWAADQFSQYAGDENTGYEICDGFEIVKYHNNTRTGKLQTHD